MHIYDCNAKEQTIHLIKMSSDKHFDCQKFIRLYFFTESK